MSPLKLGYASFLKPDYVANFLSVTSLPALIRRSLILTLVERCQSEMLSSVSLNIEKKSGSVSQRMIISSISMDFSIKESIIACSFRCSEWFEGESSSSLLRRSFILLLQAWYDFPLSYVVSEEAIENRGDD